GSAHWPVCLDITAAPSSQASQSLSTTSTYSSARSYRSEAGGCGWSPKLAAAAGSTVVTMFQPARPWLRKSSVASRLATSHGKLYVVDTVAIRPTCSVAVATDDSS